MTEFFHDSHNMIYRLPFGAVEISDEVYIALDAPENAECTLRLWSDERGELRLPMSYSGERHELRFNAPSKAGLLWYYFIIRYNEREFFLGNADDGLGGVGCQSDYEPKSWQITVFCRSNSPEWYKNSIVYQIFPDRFNRGSDWERRREASRKSDGRNGARRIWHEDWNDSPFYSKNPKGEVTRWDFFGGTLEGVSEKLDYLKSLGITAIYLNPIFKASSNHRYDTADYMEIDPALGDIESFRALAEKAKEHGIRLILDGVFSHTGADSKYFDFFGNYGGGAYSDPESKYRDWFRFKNYPDEYESWWGVGDLPNVDENNDDFRDYIIRNADSVARYWLKNGASGWRLDVADELPDSFIEEFKGAIRSEKQDALLLGEVWEDASNKKSYGESRRYLLGRELDATMHYPFRSAVTDFLLNRINSNQLCRIMMSIAENYPREALFSALNLIDSHDSVRAITSFGEAPTGLSEQEAEYYKLSSEQYELGKKRLMLASVLQFVCPGVPCIYYGDEAGQSGFADPFNRKTYPWGNEDTALLAHYRRLAGIYAAHNVLKSGDFEYKSHDNDVFCCLRFDGNVKITAYINRSFTEKRVPATGIELLSGAEICGELRLSPLCAAIIIK